MLSLSFLKRTEGTSIIKYVTFEQFDIVIIRLTVDEADSEALKTLFDKTTTSIKTSILSVFCLFGGVEGGMGKGV